MQEMKKKKKDMDGSSYPTLLGICQRLFNFIFDGLIASGFKRVTLGGHPPMAAAASVVEKPNKGPSKLNPETAAMPVYFVDRENSKDHDDFRFKEGKSGFLYIEPNRIPVSRPPRTSTVKFSSAEEEEKTKSRGKKKNVEAKESEEKKTPSSSRTPLTLKDEEKMKKAKTPPSPITVRPHLGNINEISDEYIRTRKEAMSKNIS